MRQQRFHHKFDKLALWPLDGQVYISFQKPGGFPAFTFEPNNHKFKLTKKFLLNKFTSLVNLSH